MSEELLECDLNVLMMHGDIKPVVHGAAFNACSEWLMNQGYLTQMPWQLTEKGKAALAKATS